MKYAIHMLAVITIASVAFAATTKPTTSTTAPAMTGPSSSKVFIGMKESDLPRFWKEVFRNQGGNIAAFEMVEDFGNSTVSGSNVNKYTRWTVITSDGIVVFVASKKGAGPG